MQAPVQSVDCLLPFFYIKPQPSLREFLNTVNCLLPFFYIKPQPLAYSSCHSGIVSYLFSTSNHNLRPIRVILVLLSLTFFLHQTTTGAQGGARRTHCLLPFFYIKPQREAQGHPGVHIVSYLFSTSNHNCGWTTRTTPTIVSYLFSTSNHNTFAGCSSALPLSLTFFLHQTTTLLFQLSLDSDCLLPFFYIKPQRILVILLFYKDLQCKTHTRSG